MNRYAISLFILCLSLLASGQPVYDDNAPSLVKAKTLYANGQTLDAVEMYKKAAGELSGRKNPGTRAEILNTVSVIYQTVGMLDSALLYANHSFDIFNKTGRNKETIMQLSNMGAIYYGLGNLDEALIKLNEGFKRSKKYKITSELHRLWGNKGLVSYVRGQYDTALTTFTTAYELSKKHGTQRDVAFNLGNIAMVYQVTGKYDQALQTYQKAFQSLQELGDADGQLRTINNIAQLYQSQGAYKEALEYANVGLENARKLQLDYHIAALSNTAGYIYYYQAAYTEAAAAFRSSVETFRKLGFVENIINGTIALGMVYHAWGAWDRAYDNYRQAYDAAMSANMPHLAGQAIQLMGNASLALVEYPRSLEESQKAIEIFKQLNQPHKTASALTVLGMTWFEMGEFNKARESFTRSLKVNTTYTNSAGLAVDHVHLGAVHQMLGNPDSALMHYQYAAPLLEQLSMQSQLAVCLSNIGALKLTVNQPDSAVGFLKASIAITEALRLTAEGEMRRDFLASQLSAYGHLINAFLFKSKPDSAWEVSELCSAKYLAENIMRKDSIPAMPSLDGMRKSLPNATAVIRFANMDRGSSARLILTSDTTKGFIVDDLSSLVDTGRVEEMQLIASPSLRGLKLKTLKPKTEDPATEIGKSQTLIKAVEKYRALLQNPSSQKDRQALTYLSKKLYSFLFGDIEKELQAKSELLIIPDGILAFLPFETLIIPDGRYLCEKYRISYMQSLTVATLASSRTFANKRKPLLAICDPLYAQTSADTMQKRSATELRSTIDSANATSSPTDGLYRSLGIGAWQQLPGTGVEVRMIASVVRGTKKITGASASERMLKNHPLQDYRIIHFAAHGIAVPQLPQLSALVLSTPQKPDSVDDGYLRMDEIIKLNLRADFVNLSACETGLGKIYGGEGVVGLTQAFLLAGAKTLAVSLWQVSDESTALYMAEMYRLVTRRRMTFSDAMTAVRKKFIRGAYGETFKHPFFWAPFVLYGR